MVERHILFGNNFEDVVKLSMGFIKIVVILSIISYKTINGDEFQELAITIMVFSCPEQLNR